MDKAAQLAGYGAWHNRARQWLPGCYHELLKLLDWVHPDVTELTPARAAELARSVGVHFNLDDVIAEAAAGIV